MSFSETAKTYGLVARNTISYVQEAFARMSGGHIIVPLHSAGDTHRIEVARVDEVIEARDGAGWISPRFEPQDEAKVAQILFTSGTEGEPKGVVLTHGNLLDVVRRLNSVMEVGPSIREYVGVPVYHSFGFGRCRAVAAVGGSAYLPAQGFNPLEISQLLEQGRINAISAVPSLWRILLDSNVISPRAGKRVEWIEIGSQSMSRAEKLRLRQLFPEARIVQHYGLTEASRSTFLTVHSANEEELDSVGRAYGDVEVQIAPDGRVKIRGPHVSREIWRLGEKVDPRDEEGWLETSDLGELRGELLYYGGRADDVINCGGLKIPPDALEESMRVHLARAGQFSVCRIPDAVRGDGILVAATPELKATDAELIDAAVAAASSFNVNARGATRILRVDALPCTATGKVQRKELASVFEHSLAESAERIVASGAPARQGSTPEDLRQEFCKLLGVAEVRDGDNFNDLGGDSLRFIQAGMSIQRFLGYLPDGWEHMPVAELEGLPKRLGSSVTVEASVLARALGITSVVVNHSAILAAFMKIDGAAFMLIIPMGFSFARFQLQRILAHGRPWSALGTLPRIMVPTFLLALAHQMKGGTLYPSVLLFYNNFVDHYTDGGFNFWFIEIFVQLQLIFIALCALPPFRRRVRTSPYTVSLVLFVGGFALSRALPLLWNTEHLYNLVPYRFICYFALGWCLFFAEKRWERWVNSGLVVFLSVMQLPALSEAFWVFVGGQLIAWAPAVRLPKALASAIGIVASASLYIYLTHSMFFRATQVLPLPYTQLLQIPVALVGGVALGLLVDWAWSKGGALLPKLAMTKRR